ncbi:far-red elongated hypocotyl 1 [Euphorbia peplus]|nr:far-red elongated hypocotyl 1 [Euphorbia peplus]
MHKAAIRSPSEITSFACNEGIFDLNKKRKLQAGQFSLPLSKHTCWDHCVSTEPLGVLEENQIVEDDSSSRLTNDKADGEGQTLSYGSEPAGSAKDSNSFMEDYESDNLKPLSSTATSTLEDWSCTNVKVNRCSSDVTTAGVCTVNGLVHEVEGYDPASYFDEIQEHQNIEDCVVEADGEYMFRHEIGNIEPFKTLYSNKAKPDIPFLSSGSCSVNQDAETVRKPTIDQEFEEYFSMLML